MDFGTKIFGILSKHAINTYANGYEKILAIVKHLQTISIDKKGSEEEKKVNKYQINLNFNILNENRLQLQPNSFWDIYIATFWILWCKLWRITNLFFAIFRDLSKASRPNMSSIFWKNLMNLVFLTQEIVFFTYDQYEFEVLREIPFMVISCNVIKNENEIPQSTLFFYLSFTL